VRQLVSHATEQHLDESVLVAEDNMTTSWLQIAVEGCCHGDLDKIYGTLQAMEAKEGRSIDLLICCGDFQV
jgi:hypothetical protein